MATRSLRDDLEKLRQELAALKGARPETGVAAEAVSGLENQMGELNRLVQDMLVDAEETMSRHPVATVAGALALGIIIGRLIAR